MANSMKMMTCSMVRDTQVDKALQIQDHPGLSGDCRVSPAANVRLGWNPPRLL
jgi:hypothetical protein